MNAGYRVFEQRGGGRGPLFQAECNQISVPRRWQRNTAVQMRYNVTFRQLRDPGQEEIGEALLEAMFSAVDDIVREQEIPLNYRVQLASTSNTFRNAHHASPFFPLKEWFARSNKIEALLDHLAKRLNSGGNFGINDGLEVALFVSTPRPGGKNGGAKNNPGQKCWDEMVKNKRCIIRIKNRDQLCCARAIVTMKERCHRNDPSNHWGNLRKGKPLQGFLAAELHREAGVSEGKCGLEELQKFQGYLTEYQIIVVSANKCTL